MPPKNAALSEPAGQKFLRSIRKTGGGSMNAATGEQLRPEHGGYMVGGEPDRKGNRIATQYHDEGDYRLAGISNDRQAVHRATAGRSNVFLGAWKDAGRVEIDASRRYDSHGEAMRVARQRGEKAIWDVKNGREIRT